MIYTWILEKGSRKFTCPSCGAQKRYKRFMHAETGSYADFEFGRCDREDSCGYFRRPSTQKGIGVFNNAFARESSKRIQEKTDYIDENFLPGSLKNYENNSFAQFLFKVFTEDHYEVWQAINRYKIGTTRNGATIFWQIDENNLIRTGQVVSFNAATGNRRRNVPPQWIHDILKKKNLIGKDFNLKQCLFGEHLLGQNPELPVAIVEAPKTAVIASICKGAFPSDCIWLSAGSMNNLNFEKIQKLRDRKIILYPDGNAAAFKRWHDIYRKAISEGYDIYISEMIERLAPEWQKKKGFDLADYLIEEQQSILDYNPEVDDYNAKVDAILSFESLRQDYEVFLEEQKAILIINGNLSEIEAEKIVCDLGNIRDVVRRLV